MCLQSADLVRCPHCDALSVMISTTSLCRPGMNAAKQCVNNMISPSFRGWQFNTMRRIACRVCRLPRPPAATRLPPLVPVDRDTIPIESTANLPPGMPMPYAEPGHFTAEPFVPFALRDIVYPRADGPLDTLDLDRALQWLHDEENSPRFAILPKLQGHYGNGGEQGPTEPRQERSRGEKRKQVSNLNETEDGNENMNKRPRAGPKN
ncbi:hypothetical protein HJFPF1_08077 [Paramyrothecium foliicola]|nr:hypothetical protein HJFPF1_08077 [Paramyrothecium foliicola]